MGQPYVRREARIKAEVLQLVEHSPLPVRQTLKELQIAPSTYYRWQRRYAEQGLAGLEDRPPVPRKVWNKLKEEERQHVVHYALEHPSLSSREIATRLVDMEGRFISEATVYRILKEAGLIKPPKPRAFRRARSTRSRPKSPMSSGIPMPATSSW
jgi:putative transposase